MTSGRLRMAFSHGSGTGPASSRRTRPHRMVGALAAVVLGLAVGLPASAAAATGQIPSARTSDGVPGVGAVFLFGVQSPHTCTGSVIRSPGRDLVLTAAHCLAGDGRGVQFVPGYHDGLAPYGVWDVTRAYVDPSWLSAQDAQHDYALLVVAARQWHGHRVQLGDVVTGYRLGPPPQPGGRVQVVAYPMGIEVKPITCTTTSYRHAGYPAFDCHGFVGGTSGAPWLDPRGGPDAAVRGVIGGLHQGGCFEYTSYSPRFDGNILRVYLRAVLAAPPDTLPMPGGDGC